MKVMIVPIVIGAFGTVTKGLLKGLKDLEVSGQMETALLKTVRILREESWKIEETCCHSNSCEKRQLTLMWKNLKEYVIIVKENM